MQMRTVAAVVIWGLGLFLAEHFMAGVPPEPRENFRAEMARRAEKDDYFRDDPASPFNTEKHPVEFSPLHYFAPTAEWVFESQLVTYEAPEAVVIFDTKGRERAGHVYGHLSFTKAGVTHLVRVYRMPIEGRFYYGLWFTDRTTGESTYEVGRYLDFELSDDPEQVGRVTQTGPPKQLVWMG
jgi:uncharacterized protein